MGLQQQSSKDPPVSGLLYRLRPTLQQRTKSRSTGYHAGHDSRLKSIVMLATPVANITPHASRQEAKCLAHTSPGREHNPLHQAQPTIRLASPSLNCALGAQTIVVDGMEHIPLLIRSLRAQHSSINAETQTNTSLTQIPGLIPWCRQIFRSFSPYPLRRHHTFHRQTLGLIN